MQKRLDLNVAFDRKRWSWSNVLRSALDFPDQDSIKAVLEAALSNGWKMSDPMVEHGDYSLSGLPYSLPQLAARVLKWRGESTSPLVLALSSLGVDWNEDDGTGSPMMHAAHARNWVAARSMGDCGGSWLGDAPSGLNRAPAASPMAEIWAHAETFQRRDPEDGAAIESALGSARLQLEKALSEGRATPGEWMPALGLALMTSNPCWSWGADKANAKRWREFFEWGKSMGCSDWSAPLAHANSQGESILNAAGVGFVEAPTLALALARQALSNPEPLLQALSQSGPGMAVDPRSLWAISSEGSQHCAEAESWADLSKRGASIIKALELLEPWREQFSAAKEIPVASHLERWTDESSMLLPAKCKQGWASLCVSLCAPPLGDDSLMDPMENRLMAKMGKTALQVAAHVGSAIAWAGRGQGWAQFVDEFGEGFAKAALRESDEPDFDESYDNPSVAAHGSLKVLEALVKLAGSAGEDLASTSLVKMADSLGKSLDALPVGQGAGGALSRLGMMAVDFPWGDPASPKPWMDAWARLCVKAMKYTEPHNVAGRQALGACLAHLEQAQLASSGLAPMNKPAQAMRM